MVVSLSELREMVMDREAWRAEIHGVAKSWTWVSDWTELNWTEHHKTQPNKAPLFQGISLKVEIIYYYPFTYHYPYDLLAYANHKGSVSYQSNFYTFIHVRESKNNM